MRTDIDVTLLLNDHLAVNFVNDVVNFLTEYAES